MIELDNLRTASLYINNQLLSRGLVQDGQTIDFSNPGQDEEELAATMSRIMGVVNDLILRRDRDAEHRESLSTTLRTVRAEALRQANDIQRLQDRQAEAQRRAALAEAAETALRTQLKTAESTVHRLKEEAQRTRTLVAQTRAACANEVRRRDRQIDTLKKAVADAGRARGAGRNPAVTTIIVTGEVNALEESGDGSLPPRGPTTTSDDVYDLRTETNAFLAELARGLSEENETLLELVRRTTGRLKAMSGFERENMAGGGNGAGAAETANGSVGGAGDGDVDGDGDGHVFTLPTRCEDMAGEVEVVLDHLRTILTNPSFVPIEEVVVREDEIYRLRDGWEKMETRWKEAVHLMDGWRRRMQTSGRPVNMEELKMGLRLSPVRVRDVEETAHGLGLGLGLGLAAVREEAGEEEEGDRRREEQGTEVAGREELGVTPRSPSPAESLHLVPAPEFEGDPDDSDVDSETSSICEEEDELDVNDLDVEEPNVEILEQSSMLDSPPLPPPPQLTPLRDNYSAGNRGGAGVLFKYQKRPVVDFAAIAEENTWGSAQDAALPALPAPAKPQGLHQRPTKPLQQKEEEEKQQQDPTAHPGSSTDLSVSNSSLDSILLAKPQQEEESTSKTCLAPSLVVAERRKQQVRAAPARQDRGKDDMSGSKKTASDTRKPPAPAAGPQSAGRSKPQDDEGISSKSKPSRRGAVPSSTATAAASSANSGRGGGGGGGGGGGSSNTATRSAIGSAAGTGTIAACPPSPPPPPPPPHNNANPNLAAARSPRRANSRLPLPRPTPSTTSNLVSNANNLNLNLNLNPNPLLPPPQQSPLSMATIAAKLVASEREADAARVRAKLRAARGGNGRAKRLSMVPAATAAVVQTTRSTRSDEGAVGGGRSTPTTADPVKKDRDRDADRESDDASAAPYAPGEEQGHSSSGSRGAEDEGGEEQQQQLPSQKPLRKKRDRSESRASKVASRRRSTLHPWELETLIQGGARSPPPPLPLLPAA